MIKIKKIYKILAIEISKEIAEKLEWLSSYLRMDIQDTVRFCIERVYDLTEAIYSYKDDIASDPNQLTLDYWIELEEAD